MIRTKSRMFENAFLLLPATVPGQYPELLNSNTIKLENRPPWPINASMNRILRDIDIGNAVRFRAEVNAAIFDAGANVGDRFQYPDDFDSHYAAISFSLLAARIGISTQASRTSRLFKGIGTGPRKGILIDCERRRLFGLGNKVGSGSCQLSAPTSRDSKL